MVREEAYPKKLMEDYELIMDISNPEHPQLRKRVAEEINKHFAGEEISILEIGSGNGETTKFILEGVENAKVVAVDSDKGMTGRMGENLKKYVESGKLEIVRGDAFEYLRILKDESFDCFTASWTLHNFEKDRRECLLKDVFRVLKSKGFFIVLDKYYSEDPKKAQKDFDFVVKMYEKFVEMKRADLMKELIEHEKADMGEDYIMTEKTFTQVMGQIGFGEIRVVERAFRDSVFVAEK
ncbi:MAG: class I SAM-dependent methyltransferase [archaeon]